MISKILGLVILLPLLSVSQTVDIKVNVLQSVANEAKLYRYHRGEPQLIDSSAPSAPGLFQFTLQPGYLPGLYRVVVGQNVTFNVVVSDEPVVDINTVVFAPNDSLRSEGSLGNQLYWEYLRYKDRQRQQIWHIQSLLDFYPDSLLIYQMLSAESWRLQQELYDFAASIFDQYPGMLATCYIMLEQPPVVPLELKGDAQRKALLDIWWRDVNLNCLPIAHSPGLIRRLWGYIELLIDENLDKEEQGQVFIDGITSLLTMEMDPNVRVILRDAVVEGMLGTDYYEVAEFFQTSALADLRPLVDQKQVNKRKKGEPRVRVGETAYDFFVTLEDGNRIKLSKLDAEFKLVLFWSSWCKYCLESMPDIIEVYKNYRDNGLEVISISVDDDEEPWNTHVKGYNAGWVEMREPFLIEASLYRMYDVHETPKMFLLSRDLTILSRPNNPRQLEVRLRRLAR